MKYSTRQKRGMQHTFVTVSGAGIRFCEIWRSEMTRA